MDTNRFDALAKAFARPASRRAGLKALGGALVGLTSAAAIRPQEASARLGYDYWPIPISKDDILVAMSMQATAHAARTWPARPPKGAKGKQFICNIKGIKSTPLKRFCQASTVWSFVQYSLVRSNIKQVANGSWSVLHPYPGCAVYVVDGARYRSPGIAPAYNGNTGSHGHLWGVHQGKADFFEFGGGQAIVSCMMDGSVKVAYSGRVVKSVPPGVCMAGTTTCPAGSEAACCPGDQECCDTGCCNPPITCGDDQRTCPEGSAQPCCDSTYVCCPPDKAAGCCSGTHPVCCSPGTADSCCLADFPVCCPPTTGVPDRPSGYCCPAGTTCCSTGCCGSSRSTDANPRPAAPRRGSA